MSLTIFVQDRNSGDMQCILESLPIEIDCTYFVFFLFLFFLLLLKTDHFLKQYILTIVSLPSSPPSSSRLSFLSKSASVFH